MIYNYCKAILEPLKDDPDKWNRALKTAQQELDMLDIEFCKVWTWCCGCKDYSRVDEAYEVTETDGQGYNRTALRCGRCHITWKHLD